MIGLNQIQIDVAAGHRQLIFCIDQRRLCVEHAIEIGQASFELFGRQDHGPIEFHHFGFQSLSLQLSLQEAAKSVFDFLAGDQHGLLVLERRALESRILRSHAVDDSAVIQNRPTDRRQAPTR